MKGERLVPLCLAIVQSFINNMFFLFFFQCSAIPVGTVGFPIEGLVENVLQAMKGVIHYIPGGWKNIQSVHVKSVDSIALPVYNSLPLPPTKLAKGDAMLRN